LVLGEWPSFESATVPEDQAPATITADSPIYPLALMDATKHPAHPTINSLRLRRFNEWPARARTTTREGAYAAQTAAQISPVLTKEMMATPTISLAMMSLMQTLTKDDSPAMSASLTALLKRLEEMAAQEWLAVLRETAAK